MADTEDNSAAKSRVLVFARCRPPSDKETARGDAEAISIQHEKDQITIKSDSDAIDRVLSGQAIANPEKANSDKSFVYDGCFGGGSTQKEVFSLVGLPVLVEVMKGFNGCVLAYGQTGSGKTYSLLNTGADADQAGLLPRLVATLFVRAAMDPKHVYSIEAAAFQVYNEQVDDLLHPEFGQKNSSAACNLGVSKGSVQNLTWNKCSKPTDMLELFGRARSGITYAETKMNKASSRSHAAFQIKITKRPRATSKTGKASTSLSMHATVGKLTVVDLAGSERVKKSGVTGANFKEATNINGSLLALGNVIQALASKSKHVPFRNSKLTRILEGSVGGNCKTSLLVCISPAAFNASETLSTLEFASRAMRVEVEATVNETIVEVDPARLAADLQANPGEFMDDDTLKAYRESEEALKSAKEQAKHHEKVVEGFKSKVKEMELVVTRKQREIEEAKVVAERQVLNLRKNLDQVEVEKKKTSAKVAELEVQLRQQREQAVQVEKAHSKLVLELRKATADEVRKRENAEKQGTQKTKAAEQTWNAKLATMQTKSDKAQKEIAKLQKTLKELNNDTKRAQAAVSSESTAKKKLEGELQRAKTELQEKEVDINSKKQTIEELEDKINSVTLKLEEANARESKLNEQIDILKSEKEVTKDLLQSLDKKVSDLTLELEKENALLQESLEKEGKLEATVQETKQALEKVSKHEQELQEEVETKTKQVAFLEEDFEKRRLSLEEEHSSKLNEISANHTADVERVRRHSTEAMNALEVRAAEDTAKFQSKLEAISQEKIALVAAHQEKLVEMEKAMQQVIQDARQREEEQQLHTQREIEKLKAERSAAESKAELRLAYTIASQQAARAAKDRQIKQMHIRYRNLEKRFQSRESRNEDLSLIRAQQKALREKDMKIRDSVREIRRKELELDAHRQQDRIFGHDASKKRTVLPGRYVGEHATFKERAQVVPTHAHTSSASSLSHVPLDTSQRSKTQSPGEAAQGARPGTSPRQRPGTADPALHGGSPRGELDVDIPSQSRTPHSVHSKSGRLQKPRRPSRGNVPLPPTHLYSSGAIGSNNREMEAVIKPTNSRGRRNSLG